MPLGTGTIRLSEIINEFGVGGTIPNNFRAYLACGNFLGWNGGVAQHENNIKIPSSGTMRFSDFRSNTTHVVDKDFESNNYTSSQSFYVDGGFGFYETKAGVWSTTASNALGLVYTDSSGGTLGNVDYLGKSTYNLDLNGPISSVFDYAQGVVTSVPDTATFMMAGDHRATGWGNPWISISVTIGSTVTLNRSASLVPNGTYDNINNITYWLWTGTTFGFGTVSPQTFKVRVRII